MLPDAASPGPASLMMLLAWFGSLFTAPSFRTFCGLACGFLAQAGRRTVCGMLAVEVDDGGTVHLFFDAPPESPTTRGFAGILHAGLDGLNADEVLATPGEFAGQLGLNDVVRPLRLRGMAAMLARIKRQVREPHR